MVFKTAFPVEALFAQVATNAIYTKYNSDGRTLHKKRDQNQAIHHAAVFDHQHIPIKAPFCAIYFTRFWISMIYTNTTTRVESYCLCQVPLIQQPSPPLPSNLFLFSITSCDSITPQFYYCWGMVGPFWAWLCENQWFLRHSLKILNVHNGVL